MNYWSLITITFVSHLIVINQCNSGWRHFYIIPSNNASQVRCPTNHCYSLQDVIKNQPYFFDSNTTLELMPGKYDITERIGQLVIANVSHFILRGSLDKSKPDTTIHCQQNGTFGLTFANIDNIAILDIQFTHCCAELMTNITIGATRIDDYVKSEMDISTKKWFNAYKGFCNSQNRLPCCTTIACIDNGKVIISRNIVLYSKGVGVLILRYVSLNISESLLAYNRINCITYLSNNIENTTTTLTHNHIVSEGGNSGGNIATGLNLITVSVSLITSRIDNIKVTNITFTNSNSHTSKGNFYMLIYRGVECINLAGVQITITNNTMTSTRVVSGLGIIVEYIILEKLPLYFRVSQKYRVWPQCIQPGVTWFPPRKAIVTVNIQDSSFEGTCIAVRNLLKTTNMHLNITLSNVKINKSLCSIALQLEHIQSFPDFSQVTPSSHPGDIFSPPSIIQNQLYIQNLTITSSRNNIMLLTMLEEQALPVKFLGNIAFIANKGSVVVTNTKMNLEGNLQIIGNQANEHESVFLIGNSSAVSFQGNVTFMYNRGRQGGAICAYNSNINFQGRVRFIGNIAETVGGGISLREGSRIILKTTTNMSLYANRANEYGGGIFVEETLLWESKMTLKCFIKISKNTTIAFDRNVGGLAGMALFGGWIDICNPGVYGTRPVHSLKFKTNHSKNSYSYISSNAARVCVCKNSRPIFNITKFEIKTIPGRTFEIEVVAVGQRFGVVPAIVKAEFQLQDENKNIITELERSQNVGTHCTTLSYTVHSRNNNETMRLLIDRQQVPKPDPSLDIDILQFQQLEIIINLHSCPLGFIFDSNRNICVCHYSLQKQGIQCNTTSQTVIRNAHKWISVIQVDRIAISHHCPYDFCKSYDLSINLSTPEYQCAFNRSGILCGACQLGKSQVLGTSNCKKCSNTWLLLLLPFGLAGVALVVCLMLLNLTVSTGTINGLIFYANIVRANNAIFFPGKSANTFLSWFIAWLNLDLGIETCFYDGLTGYAKTWLQFVFPVYIWVLVSAIIISSHYSTRAARICGNNAVQVLATLFFLSYAKLLRVTIAVFQPTQLLILGDGLDTIKVVWNYDGNLDYFNGQHIPLFLFTLLFFIIFFIPYTLALFGIQWLQPISHYKALFWVNRLKPLFDAYTGPYKDKHRYWTGLLLLLRVSLFCVFSANTTGDPAINLLVIVIVIICVFMYVSLLGGVYKYWPLNLLEYIFFLNLAVLSAGTLYTTAVEKSVHPVTYVSVGTALVITIFIVLYHGVHVFVKKYQVKEKSWINRKRSNNIDTNVQQCDFEVHPTVTYSVVEMEETLLHQ